MKQKITGFSLMELVIAVGILGVISAIAIPSYQSFVQKSYRSEAMNALNEVAARQAEWYSENKEYSNNYNELGGYQGGDTFMKKTETGKHTIRVFTTGGGGKYFLITAPSAGSGTNQYYLDSAGVKRHGSGVDITSDFRAPADSWETGWTE